MAIFYPKFLLKIGFLMDFAQSLRSSCSDVHLCKKKSFSQENAAMLDMRRETEERAHHLEEIRLEC